MVRRAKRGSQVEDGMARRAEALSLGEKEDLLFLKNERQVLNTIPMRKFRCHTQRYHEMTSPLQKM
jgi:hypothetical protein